MDRRPQCGCVGVYLGICVQDVIKQPVAKKKKYSIRTYIFLHCFASFALPLSLNTTHHQRFVLQTRAGRKHNGNHGNETANRQHCLSRVRMDGCMDRWGFLRGRLKGRRTEKICGRTKIRFSTLVFNTLPPYGTCMFEQDRHTRTRRHTLSSTLWNFIFLADLQDFEA